MENNDDNTLARTCNDISDYVLESCRAVDTARLSREVVYRKSDELRVASRWESFNISEPRCSTRKYSHNCTTAARSVGGRPWPTRRGPDSSTGWHMVIGMSTDISARYDMEAEKNGAGQDGSNKRVLRVGGSSV